MTRTIEDHGSVRTSVTGCGGIAVFRITLGPDTGTLEVAFGTNANRGATDE